jgi:hypothetical protein
LGSGAAPGISWFGLPGRSYSLQYRTNLLSGAWTGVPNFTNLVGAGSTLVFTNTVSGDPRGYYRVVEN